MKVAVIGAGIAGLGCAYALSRSLPAEARITLFEACARLGGHANTVDVELDGKTHPVDTGFLVFNERTYPNLVRLFNDLGVPTAASDMSFAISVPLAGGRRLEWAGSNLDTVFAQRRNLLSPTFLRMLRDILRFNRQGTRVAEGREDAGGLALGEFLDRHGYGNAFRRWYLLPMAAAIWSCPTATMLAYPFSTFVRFCHNHGLLQIEGRPQWYTVAGGARRYVERITETLNDVRLGDPVHAVARDAATESVVVDSRTGRRRFDHVVLACHSDQSLRLLIDADHAERAVLAGVRYQPNCAVLHTDVRLMPVSRKVWSAWNYMSDGSDAPAVSVTYLLNRLQPLPFRTPLFVSLNPVVEPARQHVLAEFDYAHPIFDDRAIAAQSGLEAVQGRRRVWFAGAWTGYGFHEDGLKSGLAVAASLTSTARGRGHAGTARRAA
ncbi:MAG: FAD-dependent oxidoreductase [Burkholderiaceae bacterium]|nr:FAD-dependent oxidoreductase [Burkholderiaceae bacterium]